MEIHLEEEPTTPDNWGRVCWPDEAIRLPHTLHALANEWMNTSIN
jgi:hypothetical protein